MRAATIANKLVPYELKLKKIAIFLCGGLRFHKVIALVYLAKHDSSSVQDALDLFRRSKCIFSNAHAKYGTLYQYKVDQAIQVR